MGFGGLLVLGLAIPLAALAGCASPDDAPSAQPADVAVPSYAPPSGAPGFCATLAGTTHLTGLPVAIGTLTSQPQDVGAKLELTAATDELQGVLDRVGDQNDARALAGSLTELIAVLRTAREAPLSDQARTQISSELDDVGRRAQAVCGFPS